MTDATVQIGDGWPPALPDDTYTLTIKQAATPGSGAENDYTASYTLSVAGPRFSIGPDDLHSRFPPPGSTSTYSALLPQAVLTRATLPWERALSGSLTPGALPTPFIALLVLSGSTAPAVVPGKVNDLLNPPIGTLGPAITLEKYESGNDGCAYVDMSWADFTAAVPSTSDLELLAHLRQGDPGTKALGEAPADGWYAVVIGNRFPAASQTSTAYLVSLEGLNAYFPPAAQPQGAQAVRMAVLTSWSFTDDGGTELAFTTSLQNVAKNSGALTVPPLGGDAAANAVLAQGYVPMPHATRQAQTVTSFYRGPLTPLALPEGAPQTYSCSDAALRFDPATGLLDVSYAAAWQLGRLLALNDLEVAQAIYRWRRSHVEVATRLAGRIMLARRFPSLRLARDPAALLRGHAVRRAFARVLAEDLGDALPGSPSLPVVRDPEPAPRRDTLQPADEHFALLRAFRADPGNWRGLISLDDEPIPDVVTSWLGRVHQLYGLPFNLVVPDARALPPESIRFFFLDPSWMAALTDGALSVGRATTLDADHDAAVAEVVHAAAATARHAVRARALGRDPVAPRGGALSGFLLRSAAIASWRGVEIAVYGDAARTDQLPFVRLDRLSDNVLLCIVDGTAAAVRFTQPIEGLQFGVETTTSWNVGLRGLDFNGKPAGQLLNATGSLTVRPSLTVDVTGSATALAADLVNAQAWPGGRALSSGDFAVQLLENSQIVDMKVTGPARPAAQAPASAGTLLEDGRAALQAFVARELSDD